jgi:hypothetical protein
MHGQKPRLRGVQTIADRPARIGKLKIGEKLSKEKNGRTIEYPTKLDYILAKDGAGATIAAFHDVFGDRPTEFRAVFPSNEPNDFYWEAYRRYGSGTGLVCHGDGRQAIVEETGETIDCPCQYAEGDRPTCKPVASLSLFVYEVPALGVFQIDTGSINSIKNVRWFLSALPQLTGGQYTGIPFRVHIEPFQAMHDGKASTAYQWKLDLLPGYSPMNLRMAAQEAVGAFILPPETAGRKLIDEGRPDDLYAGLPAPKDEAADLPDAPRAEVEIPEEFASVIPGAESLFDHALSRLKAPEAKLAAIRAEREHNREVAEDSGGWETYREWLSQQTARMNAHTAKASADHEAQGALV